MKREYLLASVCVILRVPSLFIMEIWFRTDPEKTIESQAVDPGPTELITTGVYYSSECKTFIFTNKMRLISYFWGAYNALIFDLKAPCANCIFLIHEALIVWSN